MNNGGGIMTTLEAPAFAAQNTTRDAKANQATEPQKKHRSTRTSLPLHPNISICKMFRFLSLILRLTTSASLTKRSNSTSLEVANLSRARILPGSILPLKRKMSQFTMGTMLSRSSASAASPATWLAPSIVSTTRSAPKSTIV